ncbi:protein-L-isoaspartate O-methyltransferase, partial [Burkholderia pseudomallei]
MSGERAKRFPLALEDLPLHARPAPRARAGPQPARGAATRRPPTAR